MYHASQKEHDREVAILRTLLAQKAFRRGKRGAWYDRLALVISHYPNQQEQDANEPEVKEQLKTIRLEEALEVCIRGLDDPLTHLVYRSGLDRRIKRLESLLKRLVTERSAFTGLDKAEERVIVGERLDKEVDRRVMGRHSVWRGEKFQKEELQVEEGGEMGEVREGGARAAEDEAVEATIKAEIDDADSPEARDTRGVQDTQTTASAGRAEVMKVDDEDDDELGPVVRVEQVALDAYAKEGWKGYHSEGGIVTTIWGLIMWDVIFAPIDGAFETAYQSEPLDLRTDSFAVGECKISPRWPEPRVLTNFSVRRSPARADRGASEGHRARLGGRDPDRRRRARAAKGDVLRWCPVEFVPTRRHCRDRAGE